MLNLMTIQDRPERIMALHYQITIKEYHEESWAAWFDDLTISHTSDGGHDVGGVSSRSERALRPDR